ncbi:hypothetical protein CPB83DRAFT_773497, partial [Crepidotus variabilis]
YCFPANYRLGLRNKLDQTIQKDKTVARYAHKIQELFNMIGKIPPEEKVWKFWKGLRTEIETALWRDKLHPEHNTFEEVLDQAERIETSLKVTSGNVGHHVNAPHNSNRSNNQRGNGGGGNSLSRYGGGGHDNHGGGSAGSGGYRPHNHHSNSRHGSSNNHSNGFGRHRSNDF